MKISAIVPAYNNESSVAHVVNLLKKHPKISEVVVVDDSNDLTPQILKGIPGIKVVTHSEYPGKGGAVITAWKHARYDVIISIDADLSRLRPKHISDMIDAFERGDGEMVVGIVDDFPDRVFNVVSGQRVYRKSFLRPYQKLIATSWYGMEQIMNYAYRKKKVATVCIHDIGHLKKHERMPIPSALYFYAREGWQLTKTEYLLRYGLKKNEVKRYISKEYYQKTIVLAPRRVYHLSKRLYAYLSNNL